MDRLTIYKASAGSGKTFRLTGEYIKLIFNPNIKFYNILAVTFTNKATAEMRERILKALHDLAYNLNSPYTNEIKTEYNLSESQIKAKAKFLLNHILYNYSRFNVSTIDSFFQKILKAFAYETGLSSGFNIELNLQQVLEISIEQFFEKAQKKPVIKNWLMNYAIQKVEEGKNWDIEKDILNFSKDAFNEVFFSFSEKQLSQLSNIESFNKFKESISTGLNEFIKNLQLFGNKTINLLKKHNLAVEDFSRGKSGVAGFMTKLASVSKNTIKEPGATVLNAHNSPDGIQGWCTKTSKKQIEIQTCVSDGLAKTLENYLSYFNGNYETYNTLIAIWKGIDVFAVVVEVFNQLSEYCREKNIFLLPLASPLLSKMIDNSDAPFIYEKTGSYLKHFMIDEFQDTSRIQWENFSPLFLNGISQDYRSLVVGDVKQSIYRWRNGDWTLLNHKLEKQFKSYGVKHEQLDFNWRSTPQIIQFNNSIFNNIADYSQKYLNGKNAPEELSQYFSELTKGIYQSANQNIPDSNSSNKGFVKAQFNENKNREEFEQWCLNEMIYAIEELLNLGTQPKEIAILVRKGKEGALVAKHLMKYIRNNPDKKNQFSFVSNDSVLLGNSSIILLLVSLLNFIVDKNNIESKASILYYYNLLTHTPTEAARKLSKINIKNFNEFIHELPTEFSKEYSRLKKQPLSENIACLLDIFIYPINSETVVQQLPFIQTFQDLILNYTKNNGPDIDGFLTWWDEYGISTPINLSENQNAIRIVTIHKSKGLEYKSVIIPFANWGLDQLPKYLWCNSPIENTNFPVVPVLYSSQLGKSKFSDTYFTEKTLALVDNLNLLYVAFTRAVETLHIFAPIPSKANDYKLISDILFALINNNTVIGNWDVENNTFTLGEPVLTNCKKEDTSINTNEQIFRINRSRNLALKLNTNEYYTNDEGELSKKINIGSIYHNVMEQIKTYNDIEKAIVKVKNSSLLSNKQAADFEKLLKSILSTEPQKTWFSNKYKILNENTIMVPNGLTKRPDRVLVNNTEIIVIDYKFTINKQSKHIEQVQEYMQLINSIEQRPVKGYVWYVLSNELSPVSIP